MVFIQALTITIDIFQLGCNTAIVYRPRSFIRAESLDFAPLLRVSFIHLSVCLLVALRVKGPV